MKNINATKGTSRMETFRMADFATELSVWVLSTMTPGIDGDARVLLKLFWQTG